MTIFKTKDKPEADTVQFKKKPGRPRKQTHLERFGKRAWDLVYMEIGNKDPEELTVEDFVGLLKNLEREKGIKLL